MTIVGLTGGIGSGKTTVAGFFKALGIPVYIADDEAKKLMTTSVALKHDIKNLFGNEAYVDNKLNRPFIANKIFNNKELLQKMNALVHPKVTEHFNNWVDQQQAPYVIKEAAILFENEGYKQCDLMITVVVDKTNRIERVLKRDDTTKEKVEAIIKNQWTDKQKIALSDYVITNNVIDETKKQVESIHQKILKEIV